VRSVISLSGVSSGTKPWQKLNSVHFRKTTVHLTSTTTGLGGGSMERRHTYLPLQYICTVAKNTTLSTGSRVISYAQH